MNMDMLTQGLSGVRSLYDDLREHGVVCDNEAEMRAYFVVSSADPEVVSGKLRQLPAVVRTAPQIQAALRVLASVQNNDPTSFFRELRRADYLTACLMHPHLDRVRERALQATRRRTAATPPPCRRRRLTPPHTLNHYHHPFATTPLRSARCPLAASLLPPCCLLTAPLLLLCYPLAIAPICCPIAGDQPRAAREHRAAAG